MANSNLASKLAKYFNISVQDELSITFNSPSVDKFFIFSTMPSFEKLSDEDTPLVPLAFTTAFVERSGVAGGGQIEVLGTDSLVTLPTRSAQRMLAISDANVVVGEPQPFTKTSLEQAATGMNLSDKTRWTFVKRLYYPVISFKNGALIKPFLAENSVDGLKYGEHGFKAVAYNLEDVFTNPASELYSIPVGILVVALTKMGSELAVRFYSNAILYGGFNGLTANARGMVMAPGGGELRLLYRDEYPLTIEKVFSMNAASGESEFLNTLKEYLGAE